MPIVLFAPDGTQLQRSFGFKTDFVSPSTQFTQKSLVEKLMETNEDRKDFTKSDRD